MMKYAIGVEYCGAAYCGWQRQSHCESVQQNLESALGFVANHPIELVCAGRTDSGVHAIEQVAHFETTAERSERAWVMGSNCRLPRDIRLKWAVPVADDFHARFSARSRAYRYIILNSPVPSAIFPHDRSSWEFQPSIKQRCTTVRRYCSGNMISVVFAQPAARPNHRAEMFMKFRLPGRVK